MPNLGSPLGTGAPSMPMVRANALQQAAGMVFLLPSIAALQSAVTAERANITAGSALYADGQPMAVLPEYAWGVQRIWSASAQHARTVLIRPGLRVTLAADDSAVLFASGQPASGTGANGDLSIDWSGNAYYLKSAGAWAQAGQPFAGAGAVDVASIAGLDRTFATNAAWDAWVAASPSLLRVGMYVYIEDTDKTWKCTATSPSVTWLDVTPAVGEANTGKILDTRYAQVYAGMYGSQLGMRGVKAGPGVVVTQYGTYIEVAANGNGGGSVGASLDQYLWFDSFNRGGAVGSAVPASAALEKGGSYIWAQALNGNIPAGTTVADYVQIESDGMVLRESNTADSFVIWGETKPGDAWELEFQMIGLQGSAGSTGSDRERRLELFFSAIDDGSQYWRLMHSQGVWTVKRTIGATTVDMALAPTPSVSVFYTRRADFSGLNTVKWKLIKVQARLRVYADVGSGYVLQWDVTDETLRDGATAHRFGWRALQALGNESSTWTDSSGVVNATGKSRLDFLTIKDLSASAEANSAYGAGSPSGSVMPKFVGQQYTVTDGANAANVQVWVAWKLANDGWKRVI